MAAIQVRAKRQKILQSVFQTEITLPTPLLSSTQEGQPFGGPATSAPNADFLASSPKASKPKSAHTPHHRQRSSARVADSDGGSDQVRWDRAWHVVTSRILLPSSVTLEDSFGTLASQSQEIDVSFADSVPIVLIPQSNVPQASHTEGLLEWHTKQVRQHFIQHVLPLLAACGSQGEPSQVLSGSIQTLEAARRQYLYGPRLVMQHLGRQDHMAAESLSQFRLDLMAIMSSSWTPTLIAALRAVLHQLLTAVLKSEVFSQGEGYGGMPVHSSWSPSEDLRASITSGPAPASAEVESAARTDLLHLVNRLIDIDLAGDKFKLVFAQIMDRCMDEYISKTYTEAWRAPGADTKPRSQHKSGCVAHLCDWVENCYGQLTVRVLHQLGCQVRHTEVQRWKNIALNRLADLRIRELFDIVLHWPQSKPGLDDLCSAVATPQRRLQLTDTFSRVLRKRLLHPGQSTLKILQIYISMIKTFHALDHSKVLLDRVVHALQLYLCQRDDAIRIVVMGLLSNPRTITAAERDTKLVELAVILSETSQQQRRLVDDDGLDWDDMDWVPDPVDAGVNYKRPKNEDVIGTLISALGASDIFIKEFQHIIAERLLSNQSQFNQETRVLGLLKKRFGETALQNCEVMLKDIQDSKRVDQSIHRGLNVVGKTAAEIPKYHSKILSRLFWPSLPKEPFNVPPPVAEVQTQYSFGFEQLKTSRKLSYMDHLGSSKVRLELEDRTIELECRTYEAAVIYAFHSDDSSGSHAMEWAFDDLWQHLMIDEDLLESALKFWVTKRVLHDDGNRRYSVLERLDERLAAVGDGAATSSSSFQAESGPTTPKKTSGMSARERETRTMYWQFIVGMLTNSSPAMPLGQIALMMKMLIADGCPWSNEELQEFLGEKITSGELELIGGKYRLPKK